MELDYYCDLLKTYYDLFINESDLFIKEHLMEVIDFIHGNIISILHQEKKDFDNLIK